jgi:hypothetical protein
LTASLICFFVDLASTMKTRVLLSSIFFMADSVVRGNLRICWSMGGRVGQFLRSSRGEGG